ncbi:MAG: ABC transporter substrate-binding protein [Candidatus Acetothermia bacterium]
MRKLSLLFLSIFLILFVISPLVSAEEDADTLVFAQNETINTRIPYKSTGSGFSTTARIFYSGLFRRDVETGEPTGDVAKDYEISEDGKTWTVHLREGVQWHHDYGELTAEDVHFTFDAHINEEIESVHEGQFWMLDEVEIVDDYTVKFHLNAPFGGFIYNLTLMHPAWGAIMCKDAYEELGPEGYEETPIGSGPYKWMPEEYVPRDHAIFEAFDDYFMDKPEIEKVEVRIISDEATIAQGVEGGEIDYTGFYNVQLWEDYVDKEGVEGDTITPPNIQKLDLNTKKSPFDKVQVRKAIAYGIDKQAINQVMMGGRGIVPDTTIFHPDMIHIETEPFEDRGFDPEKASELLAEVDMEPADIDAEFITYGNTYYQNLADLVTTSLHEAGFVNIDVTPLERGTLSERRPEPETDGVIITHPRWPDPDPFLALLEGDAIPPDGINFTWWDKADDLIEKSRHTTDEERQEVMTEIQHLLTEEVPQVPLLHPAYARLWRERVKGPKPVVNDFRPDLLRIEEE